MSLGIIFDEKLKWNNHLAKAVGKANSALCCIRLIKYYFNPEELLNFKILLILLLWIGNLEFAKSKSNPKTKKYYPPNKNHYPPQHRH